MLQAKYFSKVRLVHYFRYKIPITISKLRSNKSNHFSNKPEMPKKEQDLSEDDKFLLQVLINNMNRKWGRNNLIHSRIYYNQAILRIQETFRINIKSHRIWHFLHFRMPQIHLLLQQMKKIWRGKRKKRFQ